MSIRNCKRNRYIISQIIVFALFFGFLLPNAQAQSNSEAEPVTEETAVVAESEESFNAGTTIIEHVVDAYSWHILTYKDKHVAINLPVIIIDKEGLHVFSSKHFHHGEHAYMGYAICKEGAMKGKIIKVDENGEKEKATFLDISITKNVLALFISIALILWMFLAAAKGYKNRGVAAPKGIARALEPLILFVRDDVARPALGDRCEKFLPYLLTVFFFIFINNLIGLIPIFPGGANLTGNIAITLVLALFTFVLTNINGTKHYFVDIVNTPGVPWWLKIPIPLMPVVELVGVFTKPIVLMIRLFANITAGHIIGLGFICLIFIFGQMSIGLGYGVSVVSVFFYIFMSVLELLVAFIQAFVFTLLSAIYIGMATEHPHAHTNEIK